MDCYRCLSLGSPPYYVFLTNGSTLCLDRVSAAGESVYNFFHDVSQCGPSPIAIRDNDDTGAIVGGTVAGLFGVLALGVLGVFAWKKFSRRNLQQEENNNAPNNIFRIANPVYGLGLGDAYPNPLLGNPEPDNEGLAPLLALPQPDDVEPIPAADEELPVFGPEPDPAIVGYSAYGRPIRRTRKYPA